MMRHGRTDANQTRIVKGLRDAGRQVLVLSSMGHGCPDLLVARHGKMVLMEVKDGDKCPSAQKLTPDEERFHALWTEHVVVVKTIQEAIDAS